MSTATAVFLSLLSASAVIDVEERSSPEGVFAVAEPRPIKIAGVASRVGGRQGWSFDMTPECDLAIVRPRSTGGDELVLLRPKAGQFSVVGVLYASPSGLASPIFSPDRRKLLVATGSDHVVEIDVSSQRDTDLGVGSIPMWDTINRPVLYRYDENRRLHILERYEAGRRVEIGRDDRGINLAPVVHGSLPIGIPLPLISGSSEVVGLIGVQRPISPDSGNRAALEVTAAGVGCGSAITYPDGNGGHTSIFREGDQWRLDSRNICGLPVLPRATIKRQSCALRAGRDAS